MSKVKHTLCIQKRVTNTEQHTINVTEVSHVDLNNFGNILAGSNSVKGVKVGEMYLLVCDESFIDTIWEEIQYNWHSCNDRTELKEALNEMGKGGMEYEVELRVPASAIVSILVESALDEDDAYEQAQVMLEEAPSYYTDHIQFTDHIDTNEIENWSASRV